MTLFLDNDVIIKLANYELLKTFSEISLVNGYAIEHLDSLPFYCYIHRPEKFSKRFDKIEAWQEVKEFLDGEHVSPLTDVSFSVTEKASDLVTSGLDAGELVLALSAQETPNSGFVSGDKRAVVSLSKQVTKGKINASNFLVVSFEQAIKILVCNKDLSLIVSKVTSNPDVDKSMKAIFSSSSIKNVERLLAGLNSYICSLKKDSQSLSFFDCSVCEKRLTR